MCVLLSAPLRSNGADYVLLLFILFFFNLFIFYSPFVLRNYPTDFHQIFRNCIFWCSLNNPVVLKFFWRHLAKKTPKTAKICSKFQGLTQIFDNNFKTVKDNSNLKQTWTKGIVSLHFWQISLWTVCGQLRSICSIGWENLYFCKIATFSLLTRKLFNRFAENFIFSRSRDPLLTFLLSHDVWVTPKIQVNFRFERYWWFCLINFWNFHTIHVFEVRESIADISTELPCLGDLENPGRLPVQHVLGGTGECVL